MAVLEPGSGFVFRAAEAAKFPLQTMMTVVARLGFLAAVCVVVYLLPGSLLSSSSYLQVLVAPHPTHPSATFERRIVALGDLHGDLPNALTTLKMSGVIDEDLKWTGNVDFLVQTGDIIDR